MVLFVEALYLRTGDRVYLTLARRWTRMLVTLFAVGVITGTVLSFEMGLLWPRFTGTFGGVFGLGFAIEGFSFFMEAIWPTLPGPMRSVFSVCSCSVRRLSWPSF